MTDSDIQEFYHIKSELSMSYLDREKDYLARHNELLRREQYLLQKDDELSKREKEIMDNSNILKQLKGIIKKERSKRKINTLKFDFDNWLEFGLPTKREDEKSDSYDNDEIEMDNFYKNVLKQQLDDELKDYMEERALCECFN